MLHGITTAPRTRGGGRILVFGESLTRSRNCETWLKTLAGNPYQNPKVGEQFELTLQLFVDGRASFSVWDKLLRFIALHSLGKKVYRYFAVQI
jgi:hypothetical protein